MKKCRRMSAFCSPRPRRSQRRTLLQRAQRISLQTHLTLHWRLSSEQDPSPSPCMQLKHHINSDSQMHANALLSFDWPLSATRKTHIGSPTPSTKTSGLESSSRPPSQSSLSKLRSIYHSSIYVRRPSTFYNATLIPRSNLTFRPNPTTHSTPFNLSVFLRSWTSHIPQHHGLSRNLQTAITGTVSLR